MKFDYPYALLFIFYFGTKKRHKLNLTILTYLKNNEESRKKQILYI